ncbi:type I-E CRISPR-associated protein Cas7/Cse4/CasC [Thalassomonas haliotis]|uniref:Type I-E CRISPR-associated protein Cas7/Cse4/CasC n=1 Tax=Thalassomonas haliotis TaxID=485448 RepID=A0ABY7VH17_9GAMM|nr:type I-E CRISPR-associated protein Cas7/Cse4/CasC [Thalassomonas haliotis]WDE12326.1 type I-E CRISPR-associated protein Cas7/Cse4/CasC [Thalassomonas haliotis]
MSQFIQLHLLTSYPPANLNRDDQGRPKTAKMGGSERLRVSSQSLKRNWRISDVFDDALKTEQTNRIGIRTKLLGVNIYKGLLNKAVKEKDAVKWAQLIASQFGKLKKEDKNDVLAGLEIEQLVHISQAENNAINALVETIATEQREPEKEELDLLRKSERDVDMALFGRMLASSPEFNVEAACQVAHAISVHPVIIEDDYFTAVDDLNNNEDTGAAHIGEAGFAAGLFYTYICINKTQLIENLDNDKALADKALAALTEAAVKVSPQGKQNSFATRAYASYVLAEMGEQQPRSLSASFLKAIDKQESDDFEVTAIARLRKQYQAFDDVYGQCADARYELSVAESKGKLTELLAFVSE